MTPQTVEPFEIEAEPVIAAMLDRLVSAGDRGLALITDLRETDRNIIRRARMLRVEIITSRERRTDGGRGHVARYRLACGVVRCTSHTTD